MGAGDSVMSTTDADALGALARTVAQEAAELIAGTGADGLGFVTKSSATDLVTDADHAAERFIAERIIAARPNDGINAEEGTSDPGTSGIVWQVDPIDGTTNFVYGLPGYGVSIAAQADGVTVAGAVADVARGELFWAIAGGGAWLDSDRIEVSTTTEMSHALVSTGFSYLSERRRRQAEVLVEVLPAVRDIRRVGAASTDLCAVASGRVDAFYEKGLMPWDAAAGVLIAEEAGARTGDLDGGEATGPFVLAATPAIFENLRELLRAAGANSA